MTEKNAAQDLLADGAMTITEAMEWSGIGKTRLYDMIKEGRLAYVQMGGRKLIPRKGLRELLEKGLVNG